MHQNRIIFPTHLSLTKKQCDTKRGSDSAAISKGTYQYTDDWYDSAYGDNNPILKFDDSRTKPNECYDEDGTAIYKYPYNILIPANENCTKHGLFKEMTCLCGNCVDNSDTISVTDPGSIASGKLYRKIIVKDDGTEVVFNHYKNADFWGDKYNINDGNAKCIVSQEGYFTKATYISNDGNDYKGHMQLCFNPGNKNPDDISTTTWYLQNTVTPTISGFQFMYGEATYFLKQKYPSDRQNAKPICFGQSSLSSEYSDGDFKKTFPVVTGGEFTCLNGDQYVLDTGDRRKQGNDYLIQLLGATDDYVNLHNSGIRRSKWISQIKHNCNHLTHHNYDSYDFSQLTKKAFKKGEETKHFDLRDCITSKNGIVLDSPTWRVYNKSDDSYTWLDKRVYDLNSFIFSTVELTCPEFLCEDCALYASKSNADYSGCLHCTMEYAYPRHQCQGCPAGKKIPEITTDPITCEMCPAGTFSSGASAKMLVTDTSDPYYNTTRTWSGLQCFDACDGYPLIDRLTSVECATECPGNQYHDGTGCVDFLCIGGLGESCECPTNHELQHGVCKPCPYGQTISGDACAPCPSDKFYDDGTCNDCPAGQIPDFDKCQPCPFGQTSNGAACVACPDGQTSYGDGKCIDCPPGIGGSGGSCNFASGCTDPDACNYNDLAVVDDGTCKVPDTSHPACERCDGEDITTSLDTNDNGYCDDKDIEGCMTPGACNYDATANLQTTTVCSIKQSEACDTCDNNNVLKLRQVILGDTNPKNGVCDTKEVTGCNNTEACNYLDYVTIHNETLCRMKEDACDTCNSDGTVNRDTDDDNMQMTYVIIKKSLGV